MGRRPAVSRRELASDAGPGDPDSYAHEHTDADPYSDSDADGHADADAHSDGDTGGHGDAYSNDSADVYSDSGTNIHGDGDAHSHGDTYEHAGGHADTNPHAHRDADGNFDAATAYTHFDTETADPDADVDISPAGADGNACWALHGLGIGWDRVGMWWEHNGRDRVPRDGRRTKHRLQNGRGEQRSSLRTRPNDPVPN